MTTSATISATMNSNTELHSDLPIPPGDYLAEVLAEYALSQAELARRMDRPAQAINEIIQGQKAITHETALQLEQVLGVPAVIWLGLENEYQLTKARLAEATSLAEETGLLVEIPYAAMAKLAWVPNVRQPRERVRNLCRFFGVSRLTALPGVHAYACAFRRADAPASQYALAAWLRQGEIEARRIETGPFDKAKLRANLPAIRTLTREDPKQYLSQLTVLLASCGVALVILPHLPKTHAHGAVFWLGDRAVLQLSIRGSYADIFWFSLFHELGHLLLHGKRTIVEGIVEGATKAQAVGQTGGQGEDNDGYRRMERDADTFAQNALIPPNDYGQLLRHGTLTAEHLTAFAAQQGIAVGIVVGRLQREKYITYQQHHALRKRYAWTDDESSPPPLRRGRRAPSPDRRATRA